MQNGDYVLGHAPSELQRLDLQGELLAPATRMLLSAAGIGEGMRVLDLGSGAGDVAFLAAELVGAHGNVVGIERFPSAISRAAARAAQRRLSNVEFIEGDICDPAPRGPFDAIVGRLILPYVPEPAQVLRTQLRRLTREGVVAPIEFDIGTARTVPSAPFTDRVAGWVYEGFARGGIDPSLGPKLWSILTEAGLTPRGMLAVQPFFGPDDPGGPALVAGITKTILPLIEQHGVATAADVCPETLDERIAADLAGARAVLAHPSLYCAWGTR